MRGLLCLSLPPETIPRANSIQVFGSDRHSADRLRAEHPMAHLVLWGEQGDCLLRVRQRSTFSSGAPRCHSRFRSSQALAPRVRERCNLHRLQWGDGVELLATVRHWVGLRFSSDRIGLLDAVRLRSMAAAGERRTCHILRRRRRGSSPASDRTAACRRGAGRCGFPASESQGAESCDLRAGNGCRGRLCGDQSGGIGASVTAPASPHPLWKR